MEDLIELPGGGTAAMHVFGRRRGPREARIVLGPVRLLQKRVGGVEVARAKPTQFLHQAILVRPMIAFDPAFRLRRVRRNNLDAQRLTHPPELRARHDSFGPFGLIGDPDIDVFPVGVERLRNAVRFDPPAQHLDGRPDCFLLAEAAQTLTRRVVH